MLQPDRAMHTCCRVVVWHIRCFQAAGGLWRLCLTCARSLSACRHSRSHDGSQGSDPARMFSHTHCMWLSAGPGSVQDSPYWADHSGQCRGGSCYTTSTRQLMHPSAQLPLGACRCLACSWRPGPSYTAGSSPVWTTPPASYQAAQSKNNTLLLALLFGSV